uniref:tRNA-dihydrouridine(16/17) synthase [NAD(P)(+)]-like n=1 Tax=Phallusia mammillata TaxID=59560 RepID=A0A6F9DAQ5_9ASCI|nr:tRNA-dihydrouridine(16/17) synthase [NAD(P)(+)]-like [Phallusia mammillata]
MTNSSLQHPEKDSVDDAYKLFKQKLHSPKYVVAPMVDQSELAWRMLARRHGANLCFTPMFSANTFINDATYRKRVLEDLSCKEDRPLIVQFCANNAENFVNASKLVEIFCDGVDLNLGCPQHIARRGHFGAFLQEDWELIQNILQCARQKLSVVVSAKIRVFPEIGKTIQYAEMLQKAGCHFITVHGRTREQKGALTGKASWLHIKAVKNSLNIPVFANGNIQYKKDIDDCLQETGVDGVMTAEGHLNNPYIFEGKQPYVNDVVQEYLKLVKQFPCPLSYVRTHLFHLWAHALQVHKDMREKFGQASTLEDLNLCNEDLNLRCVADEKSGAFSTESTPHWICQPYIRPNRRPIQPPAKTNDDGEVEKDIGICESQKLSKNKARRLARYEKKIAVKKLKRKKEHDRKKQREKAQLQQTEIQTGRVLRKCEKKEIIVGRLKDAMNQDASTITVCIDLSWTAAMNEKEVNKLAGQLGRLYGSNRKAEKPARLYFSSFDHKGALWKECIRKHDGFENYLVHMISQPYHEKFCNTDIIYLTPDAEEALMEVCPGVVYILGGLVDETVVKKLTLDGASVHGFITRRLPVQEYMQRVEGRPNYSTVYSINQVFDILLTFYSTQCWRKALEAGVPPRKGYVFKNTESSC